MKRTITILAVVAALAAPSALAGNVTSQVAKKQTAKAKIAKKKAAKAKAPRTLIVSTTSSPCGPDTPMIVVSEQPYLAIC
jgi:hypothetical protein